MNISSNELKIRISEIEKLMELSQDDKEILLSVIDNDSYGLSLILISEGIIRQNLQELDRAKLEFLKEYSGENYNEFKKFYKSPIENWDFLDENQLSILKLLSNIYIDSLKEYFENRGDLMIYRKTINSFIQSRLNKADSLEDLESVRNYLMNNYSYKDSLFNLGLNPETLDNGLLKLDRRKEL